MPATQTAALALLLTTMTPGQRAALLDVLGSATENAECAADEQEDLEDLLETEGHLFIVAMRDAVISHIAA